MSGRHAGDWTADAMLLDIGGATEALRSELATPLTFHAGPSDPLVPFTSVHQQAKAVPRPVLLPSSLDPPNLTAGRETLAAEYRVAGVDPALIALLKDKVQDAAPRPAPRFTIRRVKGAPRHNYPWKIRDSERPWFIGRAQTHDAAMLRVDREMYSEATS